MAERKVILFLVEGKSDEIALGQPLSRLLKDGLSPDWGRFKTDVFTAKLYPDSAFFDVKGKIGDTIRAFVEAHVNRGNCEYELEDIAHRLAVVTGVEAA